MKIRQGFVSNSSSSSFIIALDKKPESSEELQDILFGTEEYCYYDCDRASTKSITEAVFEQLKLKSPLTLGEIIEELVSGGVCGINTSDSSELPEFWLEDQNGKHIPNPKYEEYLKIEEEKEIVAALEYFNNWKCSDDQVLFGVEFSDETEFGCICEHGEIFHNIHSIRISHH